MILGIKKRLVGSALGRSLMRIRELRALFHAMRTNPERAGFLSQEICARMLLPGLCEKGRLFVDVGAHVGSVIADVKHRRPSIQIVGVEADSCKAASLMRRFPDVQIHDCAVGEAEGQTTFYVDEERSGCSSLAPGKGTVTELSVRMRCLDDILMAPADAGVIKIDVVGAELAVLKGASSLLDRCRPVVQFESWFEGGAELGFSKEQLFEWWSSHGYEVLVPNRVAHDGPSLDLQGFVESHYHPRRALNYYAIPSERRLEVRDRARAVLGIAGTN